MSRPPNKLLSRLKVAPPRHMAKKKSFRSAPRMVSGRDNDRCTLLIRRVSGKCCSPRELRESAARKEPREEIHGGDRHADTEENARQHSLRAAFPEGEGQPCDHNGDERKTASDGRCERLHQNVDCVLPRRATCGLGECRRSENQRGRECDEYGPEPAGDKSVSEDF